MSRGSVAPHFSSIKQGLTKRQLFSICGKLVSHYPVAGWLRPCCSFLKLLGCGGSWDEPVSTVVYELTRELLERVRKEDPVRADGMPLRMEASQFELMPLQSHYEWLLM